MKLLSFIVAVASCAVLIAPLGHAQAPDGPRIEYSTYFGGPGADLVSNVTVEPGGTILVVGGSIGGNIARLSADGTQVLASTSIQGGSANLVAIGKNGTVYVAGAAGTSLATVRPIQAAARSGSQGFVAVLTPDLEDVTFCTYLGGSSSTGAGQDAVLALAIDAIGRIYVAGTTQGDNNDFPIAHATQASYGGGSADGFVSVIDPQAPSLVFSTYFGDADAEQLTSIAIDDENGAFYVAGIREADSAIHASQRGTCAGVGAITLVAHYAPGDALNEVNLRTVQEFCKTIPHARPVMQFVRLSQQDPVRKRIVVADSDTPDPAVAQGDVLRTDMRLWVFDEDLTLLGERMLGGGGEDVPAAIAADVSGRVYVLGDVDRGGFPLSNAFQPSFGGGRDTLVVGLDPETLAPVFASYLGGSGDDVATGMSVDTLGRVVVVGHTTSVDFSTTPNALQATLNGPIDGFVTRITGLDHLVPDYSVSAMPSTVTTSRGQSGQIAIVINRFGRFAGRITVTAPDTKPIKVKLKPSSIVTTGDSVVFTFKAKKKAVLGVHALVFKGRDDLGRERTDIVDLTVQ